MGGSFQVFVSSLGWLLWYSQALESQSYQSDFCRCKADHDIHMVILISIYIFMPATRVSLVAEAIRETTNQIGMALL